MSSSETLWLKIWEIIATVGFVLVIIGVVIEGVEHFKKFSKKEQVRKLHIEKIGWLILVAGLAMEFLGDHAAKRISNRENARLHDEATRAQQAAGEANERAAKLEAANLVVKSKLVTIDPLNQPVSDMSAIVSFKVKGSNGMERAPFGSPHVAWLMLCDTNIAYSMFNVLVADSFIPVNHPLADNCREYIMQFHLETIGAATGLEQKIRVKAIEAIENANMLRIDVKFLPIDSEILGGSVRVIINAAVPKEFLIPPQKAFEPLILTNVSNYQDSFRIIAAFGTNTLPINRGPQKE